MAVANDQATIPTIKIYKGIVVYLAKIAHTMSSIIWANESVANNVIKLLLNMFTLIEVTQLSLQ